MKKFLCCLLFLGIVFIGCQNKDNSDDFSFEEIDVEEVETINNTTDSAMIGKKLLEEGNITEAIKQFNKALKEGEKAWIYGDLGRAKQANGDLNGAIKCFTKAIELNDKDAIYYEWRSSAYRDLGKEDLAEQDQKLADELNAKDTD